MPLAPLLSHLALISGYLLISLHLVHQKDVLGSSTVCLGWERGPWTRYPGCYWLVEHSERQGRENQMCLLGCSDSMETSCPQAKVLQDRW